MISLEELDREISELEVRESSYLTLERLSWLYVVRDHMIQNASPAKISRTGDTEFLQMCEGVPVDRLLSILSDHFEDLRIVYPKEYDHVLNRIKILL